MNVSLTSPQEKGGLLMIAYYFPPVKAIGTIRNHSIAIEFNKYFENIFVVSTSNHRFLPRQALPDDDIIQPVYARTIDYRQVVYWINGKSENLQGSSASGPLLKRLLQLKDSFPFNILIDEGSLVYIFSAYRKARQLIRRNEITHIYSSFRPYADHLVAYLLKLEFPNLFWIADFRDPHVDLNRHNTLWPGLQHAFNRIILQKANLITTVSYGLAHYFQRYNRPIYVLRNGINPSFVRLFQAIESISPPKFRITYTGSIYPDQQSANVLFAALQRMLAQKKILPSTFELHYVGKDKAVWDQWIEDYQLKSINHSVSQRSLIYALTLQKQSHINLLLSWSGPVIRGILTGKLYEYLAAGRPILGIIHGSKDREFEALFEQLQAGLLTYDSTDHVAQVEQFISGYYEAWFEYGSLPANLQGDRLQPLHWNYQMHRFMQFLRHPSEWDTYSTNTTAPIFHSS